MSRIQNILEKAEREGVVRRIQNMAEAAAAVAPVEPPVFVAPPQTITDPIGPGSIAPIVPRVVTGARLDPRLLPALAADATATEQYRALRTRILHADNGVPVSVVLVTSPGRAEGKTLTAANLGLTMAQEYQRRICIVDTDLRHPEIHRLFGLPEAPGLAEVLTGDAALEDALVTIEEHQLTVLPGGHTPGRPAELLGTVAMRRTIEALRSQFDRVLVDAAAASPLADVGILTPLVDAVLLVVRAGITSRPAIHDAVAAIDPSKLLGMVLNEAA